MYWVEGIGSIDDPFYAFDCYTGGCESFSFLGCFENGGSLQYENKNVSECRTTKLNEYNSNDSDFKLYPTITSNSIQIENNSNRLCKILVVNSLGQVVVKETLPPTTKTIDVNNLPSGIYFASFWDKVLLKTIKFIKN